MTLVANSLWPPTGRRLGKLGWPAKAFHPLPHGRDEFATSVNNRVTRGEGASPRRVPIVALGSPDSVPWLIGWHVGPRRRQASRTFWNRVAVPAVPAWVSWPNHTMFDPHGTGADSSLSTAPHPGEPRGPGGGPRQPEGRHR